MARRKDHTPEELHTLILGEARKLVASHGLGELTARRLATAIGYSPGTIYNVFRDLDDLILAVNFETLGDLFAVCREKLSGQPKSMQRVKALAYAYLEFAETNTNAWLALYAYKSKHVDDNKLPAWYRERLDGAFGLIEHTLQECLGLPPAAAREQGRLLWACLHGITALAIDSRLKSVGVDNPKEMIDILLDKCLVNSKKG